MSGKANTTRQFGQRHLVSARGHIEQCGQRLFAFSELYQEVHPELSIPVDQALELLKLADAIIAKIEQEV